jgi:hypothetical protein
MNRETLYAMGEQKLRELLAQCKPGQQELFHLMYPKGIENIPDDELSWAIIQCENTIKKNERGLL